MLASVGILSWTGVVGVFALCPWCDGCPLVCWVSLHCWVSAHLERAARPHWCSASHWPPTKPNQTQKRFQESNLTMKILDNIYKWSPVNELHPTKQRIVLSEPISTSSLLNIAFKAKILPAFDCQKI